MTTSLRLPKYSIDNDNNNKNNNNNNNSDITYFWLFHREIQILFLFLFWVSCCAFFGKYMLTLLEIQLLFLQKIKH